MVKCYCHKSRSDVNSNCSSDATCKTDSYCVLMLSDHFIPFYFCNDGSHIGCSNTINEPLDLANITGKEAQLCCNDTELCNQKMGDKYFRQPVSALPTSITEPRTSVGGNIIIVAILPIVLLVIALVSCFAIFCSKRKTHKSLTSPFTVSTAENGKASQNVFTTHASSAQVKNVPSKSFQRINSHHSVSESYGGSSNDPLLSSSRLPDTSNSKVPGVYLSMRTISSDIKLIKAIGTGRYGQVYMGHYAGSDVAVKKLPIREESSWANERAIYAHLRHISILQFVASDRVATNLATELWLVVDYHKNGSLLDFLNSACGTGEGSGVFHTEKQALKTMSSIAAGLAYLHQDIRGTPPDYKPGIAHCDLKSRNILVKDDLTCCIADFGLAVTHESFLPSTPDVESRRRRFIIGTRRYSAPDLLEMEMNSCECTGCHPERDDSTSQHRGDTCRRDDVKFVTFEQCRQADLYSVALVLWEICRRVKPWGLQAAQLPFFEYFTKGEPTVEEIHNIVFKRQLRPQFNPHPTLAKEAITRHQKERVLGSEVYYKLQHIMSECWAGNASARIPALLVKKKLDKLIDLASSAYQHDDQPLIEFQEPLITGVEANKNMSVLYEGANLNCDAKDYNSNVEKTVVGGLNDKSKICLMEPNQIILNYKNECLA